MTRLRQGEHRKVSARVVAEDTKFLLMLKREHVLDFLFSRGHQPFTTMEISEALEVREYQARGAVSWLKLGGYIEVIGMHASREHVRVYKWTGKTSRIITVRRDEVERHVKNGTEQCRNMKSAADSLERAMMLSTR